MQNTDRQKAIEKMCACHSNVRIGLSLFMFSSLDLYLAIFSIEHKCSAMLFPARVEFQSTTPYTCF